MSKRLENRIPKEELSLHAFSSYFRVKSACPIESAIAIYPTMTGIASGFVNIAAISTEGLRKKSASTQLSYERSARVKRNPYPG